VGRVAVSCSHCRSIPQQETATRPTGNGNLVAIDRTPLRGCTHPIANRLRARRPVTQLLSDTDRMAILFFTVFNYARFTATVPANIAQCLSAHTKFRSRSQHDTSTISRDAIRGSRGHAILDCSCNISFSLLNNFLRLSIWARAVRLTHGEEA